MEAMARSGSANAAYDVYGDQHAGVSPTSAAIAVLDFGSQYTNLIRRSLLELSVACAVLPPSTPASRLHQYRGVILSGGPASVYGKDAPTYDPKLFDLDVPILGICYGHQLMASALGGKVERGGGGEYGRARLEVVDDDHMFTAIPKSFDVWMSRGDVVTNAPPGFRIIAQTDLCPVAAMADDEHHRYSVQFHPEVAHTTHGTEVLQNFAIGICKCGLGSHSHDLIHDLTEQICAEVGDKRVFLMLSGGVDSTVAYLLLAKALGPGRVRGLHVDTGLLRHGEVAYVRTALGKAGIEDFMMVDAAKVFLERLRGVTDPEAKRRVIATTFLEVKDEEMVRLGLEANDWVLGQGTIYPDLIASGVSQHSHTIKTHHNSLLRERSSFPIVEPLKLLYKDEVRRIGEQLGLSKQFLWREPFPGPGLAIRVLGEVSPEKLELQRAADRIVAESLAETEWPEKLWHKFPVIGRVDEFGSVTLRDGVLGSSPKAWRRSVEIAQRVITDVCTDHGITFRSECMVLPFRSVGVKGDARSYEPPLAVGFWDGAECARVPTAFIEELSSELTNQVPHINRVVLNVTPGLGFAAENVHAFLRLITSRDAMTADWAKVEMKLLCEMAERIVGETEIERVYLDVTQKPPAMMEWE